MTLTLDLKEKDVHMIIVEHLISQLFPEWNKSYKFPSIITALIAKYSSCDHSDFFDLNKTFWFYIAELFPNVSPRYLNNDSIGRVFLKSKYQQQESYALAWFEWKNTNFQYVL